MKYEHIWHLSFFNPITPKSEWHLISPYNIWAESNIMVGRIKEMITNWRSSWLVKQILLVSTFSKCVDNNMENINIDIWKEIYSYYWVKLLVSLLVLNLTFPSVFFFETLKLTANYLFDKYFPIFNSWSNYIQPPS